MGDNTSPKPSAPSTSAAPKTTQEQIPYWHVNVPPALRTPDCPPFLQNLNPKDLRIISTPDRDYHVLTWPEVRSIISANRLDLFQRVPSDLRRYLENNYHLKQRYGSVMDYILTHRLGWEQPLVAAGRTPFEREEEDVKMLWNDWPYGIDQRIVHLVVWTKFVLEEDPTTGDLTEEMRGRIEEYVRRRFCDGAAGGLERDNVIWFKNWASLKSIHAVEHFHVMLFDPSPEFIDNVTNGDVPLFKRGKVWEEQMVETSS